MSTQLSDEVKKEYNVLSRQVDEAHRKLFDQGRGGRNKRSPNNYNNRLQRMKEFCIENGINTKYLKYNPL